MPIKTNPSGIGSSIAFEATTANKDPVSADEADHMLTVQQQDISQEHVHSENFAEKEQALSANVNEPSEHPILRSDTIEGETTQPLESIAINNTTPPTPTVNNTLDISQNSFSMPLTNVIDVVARSAIVVNHGPIITPVQSFDVNPIRADPDEMLDPTLHKDINFMKTWLDKAAVNEEVPFSPVIYKSQKKKLAKQNKAQTKASCSTRSQGPLPSSQ